MRHRVIQHPPGESGAALRHYREACSSQRALLRELYRLDRAEVWKRDGHRDMATWVAATFGVTYFQGERWVTAGAALERLPLLAAALDSGAISFEKALELARFATPENEASLLRWAERVCPRTIRARGERERREAAPPDEIERDRSLTWNWSVERDRLELYAVFPPEQGHALVAAIEAAAADIPHLPEEERPEWMNDDDLVAQRRADALWLLAGGGSASVPEVVAHVPVGLVTGDPAYLERGVELHPATAERLACDSRLRFVLTDDDGNALGVGDAARTPPRWLERAVRHRDRHRCTFPGCPHGRFLQSHHLTPFPTGPTAYDNLITVCPFHHKLVHEFGWSARLAGAVVEWYRPDGGRYDPRANLRGPP